MKGLIEQSSCDWFAAQWDAIDAHATGVKQLFTVFEPDGEAGVKRNEDSWVRELDLSGICHRTSCHPRKGATLVSPDVVVFSAIFPLEVGAVLYFVGKSGDIYSRTLVSTSPVEHLPTVMDDIVVGRLDQFLPPGDVQPFSLLARGSTEYVNFAGVPVLVTDQERKATVARIRRLTEYFVFFEKPLAPLDGLFEELSPGDSGHPSFLVIDGEPILLSTHTYGGAGSGPYYSEQRHQILLAMERVGSDYGLMQAKSLIRGSGRQELLGFYVNVPKSYAVSRKRIVRISHGDTQVDFDIPVGDVKVSYALPRGTLVRVQVREEDADGRVSTPRVLVDRVSDSPGKQCEDFYLEPRPLEDIPSSGRKIGE